MQDSTEEVRLTRSQLRRLGSQERELPKTPSKTIQQTLNTISESVRSNSVEPESQTKTTRHRSKKSILDTSCVENTPEKANLNDSQSQPIRRTTRRTSILEEHGTPKAGSPAKLTIENVNKFNLNTVNQENLNKSTPTKRVTRRLSTSDNVIIPSSPVTIAQKKNPVVRLTRMKNRLESTSTISAIDDGICKRDDSSPLRPITRAISKSPQLNNSNDTSSSTERQSQKEKHDSISIEDQDFVEHEKSMNKSYGKENRSLSKNKSLNQSKVVDVIDIDSSSENDDDDSRDDNKSENHEISINGKHQNLSSIEEEIKNDQSNDGFVLKSPTSSKNENITETNNDSDILKSNGKERESCKSVDSDIIPATPNESRLKTLCGQHSMEANVFSPKQTPTKIGSPLKTTAIKTLLSLSKNNTPVSKSEQESIVHGKEDALKSRENEQESCKSPETDSIPATPNKSRLKTVSECDSIGGNVFSPKHTLTKINSPLKTPSMKTPLKQSENPTPNQTPVSKNEQENNLHKSEETNVTLLVSEADDNSINCSKDAITTTSPRKSPTKTPIKHSENQEKSDDAYVASPRKTPLKKTQNETPTPNKTPKQTPIKTPKQTPINTPTPKTSTMPLNKTPSPNDQKNIDAETNKSKSEFPSSWTQTIRGTVDDGIDKLAKTTPSKRVSKSPVAPKRKSFTPAIYSSSSDEDEDDEDGKPTNEFADDEAMEVDEDEESMDEEERQYLKDNEIEERGIHIGSDDTDTEGDYEDGDEEEYDKDSFIASEDEVHHVDSDDDLDAMEKKLELDEKQNKVVETARRRASRQIQSDEEENDDDDVVNGNIPEDDDAPVISDDDTHAIETSYNNVLSTLNASKQSFHDDKENASTDDESTKDSSGVEEKAKDSSADEEIEEKSEFYQDTKLRRFSGILPITTNKDSDSVKKGRKSLPNMNLPTSNTKSVDFDGKSFANDLIDQVSEKKKVRNSTPYRVENNKNRNDKNSSIIHSKILDFSEEDENEEAASNKDTSQTKESSVNTSSSSAKENKITPATSSKPKSSIDEIKRRCEEVLAAKEAQKKLLRQENRKIKKPKQKKNKQKHDTLDEPQTTNGVKIDESLEHDITNLVDSVKPIKKTVKRSVLDEPVINIIDKPLERDIVSLISGPKNIDESAAIKKKKNKKSKVLISQNVNEPPSKYKSKLLPSNIIESLATLEEMSKPKKSKLIPTNNNNNNAKTTNTTNAFRVEPLTPTTKISKQFKVSPLTPDKPRGFNVVPITPTHNKDRKKIKRKLLIDAIEEPSYVLPNKVWTTSGIFEVEDLNKKLSVPNSSTDWQVSALEPSKKKRKIGGGGSNVPSYLKVDTNCAALDFKRQKLYGDNQNKRVPAKNIIREYVVGKTKKQMK